MNAIRVRKSRPELLTHPNIPKPLHGLNPRNLMGQDWWDKTRAVAYAKTDYCCAACGVHKSKAQYHKWLEAHEVHQINYAKGEAKVVEVVALCHSCHNYIHSGRLSILYRKGEITHAKSKDILRHGGRLINGLRCPQPPVAIAAWNKWHLILNGKKFYSKFKSFEDWEQFYNR